MKISRRKFFLNTGIATLTAVVVLPAQNIFGQSLKTEQFFPIPPETTNDALNYLRREHFEPFVNAVFQFQPAEGRAFNLKLIAVENLTLGANEKQGLSGESFSLLFEGSKKSKVPQEIFQIDHGSLGTFSLFIAPVGLRGNRYEAIINRINV
jgi:hypothetical protein